MEKLVVALPKGRIMDEAIELLRECGFTLPKNGDLSRKLIIEDEDAQMTFILAKPSDVPIYVEYGAADLGVVGKDVLLEENRDVYELLDLKIAACRLCVAGIPGTKTRMIPRIATKFSRIASDYYRQQGKQVEIIKLNGSIEIAPLIGLSDCIVDIVSTGRTLKDNGLVEMEEIMPITSRLIANRMSYRMKHASITHVVETLEKVVK